MSDELKTNVTQVDGFDDGGATEGDFVRVIQGEKWSFSNEGTWVNADGRGDFARSRGRRRQHRPGACKNGSIRCPSTAHEVPHARRKGRCRTAQRNVPPIRVVGRSEWQAARSVAGPERRLHGRSCDHAEVHVSDQHGWRRHLRRRTQRRSQDDAPIPRTWRIPRRVRGTKHMKTRFACVRPRPHFVIKRWISFGPDGTAALPSASPPSLQAPASASQQGPDRKAAADQHGKTQDKSGVVPSGVHVVEEPTLHEELNDAIPENW